MQIEKPADVERALREAFAQKERLVFLDFITDQKENVFPMVPGGKGITEMILARSCDADTSFRSWSRTRRARCPASRACSPRAATTSRSLTVAPTEDASMSRMTIVTTGSDDVVEQITKQLNKLVEVVKVVDLSEGEHIERELMLVKVRAGGQGARGDEAHGRHLPRPHHRRHRQQLHDRADRRHGASSTRSSRRSTGRDPRDGAHRGESGIGRGERVLRV